MRNGEVGVEEGCWDFDVFMGDGLSFVHARVISKANRRGAAVICTAHGVSVRGCAWLGCREAYFGRLRAA